MPCRHAAGVEAGDRIRRAEGRRAVVAVVERHAEGELHREAHHVIGNGPRIIEQQSALDRDRFGVEPGPVEHVREQSRGGPRMFGEHRGAHAEEIGAERWRDRPAQRLHGECQRGGIVPFRAAQHRAEGQGRESGAFRRGHQVAPPVDAERELPGLAEARGQDVEPVEGAMRHHGVACKCGLSLPPRRHRTRRGRLRRARRARRGRLARHRDRARTGCVERFGALVGEVRHRAHPVGREPLVHDVLHHRRCHREQVGELTIEAGHVAHRFRVGQRDRATLERFEAARDPGTEHRRGAGELRLSCGPLRQVGDRVPDHLERLGDAGGSSSAPIEKTPASTTP